MNAPIQLVDTFRNWVAGFGTFKDKSVHQEPFLCLLNQKNLHDLYRGDWLARKIVDIPALDSTRAWREWQAEKKDITELEKCERELCLQQKLLDGLTKSRLYGGAVLIMGVDQGHMWEELNVDKVGKGDLKFVHVVERWQLAASERVRDILSPYFGQPHWYRRSNMPITPSPDPRIPSPPVALPSEQVGGQSPFELYIHPSRVVRLIGLEYPDLDQAPDSWGDSVLQPCYDALQQAGLVNSSIAAAISEMKVDVVKVAGVASALSTEAGTRKYIERFTQSNIAKSIVNTLLIDKETEEWERLQFNMSNVDKVQLAFLLVVAGAADIPATRLLGRSPSGMDATGESDIRNYYDACSAGQEIRITPALSKLDEVLIRHAFGRRPDEIHYRWRPLWQMSDKEKADVHFKKAQAHKVDVDAGLINPDALRMGRENELIESGFVYQGLEEALDEADKAGDLDLEEDQRRSEEIHEQRMGRGDNPDEPGGDQPFKKKAPNGNGAAADAAHDRAMGEFEEIKHPRGFRGQWVEAGMVASALPSVKNRAGEFTQPDLATMKKDPGFLAKTVELFKSPEAYPNFRPSDFKGTASDNARMIIDHMKSNIRFLYDHASPETVAGGKVWYDTAHRMAIEDAKKYGLSEEASAGVMATLSPNKAWEENLYLAHVVIDINATQQNHVWDAEMETTAAQIWKPKDKELVDTIRGKKLGELKDPAEKGAWIRTYDQAHNDLVYHSFDPVKGLGAPMMTKANKPKTVRWQSIPMAANAVACMDSGGDVDVISEALGDRHKVRSFYNNILRPHAKTGDVTVDTHAIGAALLRQLASGTSTAVIHGLGSTPKVGERPPGWIRGAPKSARFGLVGSYPLYAQAYRETAAELNMLPQQLQAIVWDSKRTLFNISDAKRAAVEAAWTDYHNGRASQPETQEKVLRIAHADD